MSTNSTRSTQKNNLKLPLYCLVLFLSSLFWYFFCGYMCITFSFCDWCIFYPILVIQSIGAHIDKRWAPILFNPFFTTYNPIHQVLVYSELGSRVHVLIPKFSVSVCENLYDNNQRSDYISLSCNFISRWPFIHLS